MTCDDETENHEFHGIGMEIIVQGAENDLTTDMNKADFPRNPGRTFPGSAVTRAKPKGERSKFMRSGQDGGVGRGEHKFR